MAESPSHKFGQLIGNLLEELIEPFLTDFANRSGLYLDYQKNARAWRILEAGLRDYVSAKTQETPDAYATGHILRSNNWAPGCSHS